MSLTNRGDTVGDFAETIATLCRTYREEGSLADAQAALRQGLAAHPRDVRLLVERVLLDNLSEQQQGRCPRNVTQSRPSVEIIFCVYNALDDTKRCLDSIQSKTTYPYSLTIIDDASAAEVRDVFERIRREPRQCTRVLEQRKSRLFEIKQSRLERSTCGLGRPP